MFNNSLYTYLGHPIMGTRRSYFDVAAHLIFPTARLAELISNILGQNPIRPVDLAYINPKEY